MKMKLKGMRENESRPGVRREPKGESGDAKREDLKVEGRVKGKPRIGVRREIREGIEVRGD